MKIPRVPLSQHLLGSGTRDDKYVLIFCFPERNSAASQVNSLLMNVLVMKENDRSPFLKHFQSMESNRPPLVVNGKIKFRIESP